MEGGKRVTNNYQAVNDQGPVQPPLIAAGMC